MTPPMRIWRPGPLPSLVFLTQPHLGLVGFSPCVCLLSRVWLRDPRDCSSPGSSVHGILQARRLEWVAISSSRGSSPPGIEPRFSCIGRRILYHCTPWESRAAPFGDSLSLDVPDRNKKRYPSSPQGSLTCSFRLAAMCKTRSRGMLWHATISIISAGAGSFIIWASGGGFPLPPSSLAYVALRQEEPWIQLHCWAPNTSQGTGCVATNQARETKRPGFLTETIWEEEPEPWSPALV